MEPRDRTTGIFRDIQFAIGVLAKSGQVSTAGIYKERAHPLALSILCERPDASADEITENVIARERCDIRSVVHVTSDNGRVTLQSVIVKDRIQKR